MTDSFSRVIGTPRDQLPELDNYQRTAADLTDVVNDRIDENITDTKDFFNQMIEIADLQQKSRDNRLAGIAELTGQIAQFRDIRRRTESVRENIRQADLRMNQADKSLDVYKKMVLSLKLVLQSVANDKISGEQKDS